MTDPETVSVQELFLLLKQTSFEAYQQFANLLLQHGTEHYSQARKLFSQIVLDFAHDDLEREDSFQEILNLHSPESRRVLDRLQATLTLLALAQ